MDQIRGEYTWHRLLRSVTLLSWIALCLPSVALRETVPWIIKYVFCLAGRMGAGEKKNSCNVQYRRPFGCAVLSIADLLAGDSKDDLVLKVYM